MVQKNLGKIIRAKQDPQDPNVFFTEAFVAKNMAAIRGALIGTMKPTAVNTVLNVCGVQDRLFFCEYFDTLNTRRPVGVILTLFPCSFIASP